MFRLTSLKQILIWLYVLKKKKFPVKLDKPATQKMKQNLLETTLEGFLSSQKPNVVSDKAPET